MTDEEWFAWSNGTQCPSPAANTSSRLVVPNSRSTQASNCTGPLNVRPQLAFQIFRQGQHSVDRLEQFQNVLVPIPVPVQAPGQRQLGSMPRAVRASRLSRFQVRLRHRRERVLSKKA